MVIIGAMASTEFADLRLDWGAVKRAAGLAQLFRRGDNGLLAGIAEMISAKASEVVGAQEVAPGLLAPLGPIGGRGFGRGRDGDCVRREPARSALDLRRGAGRDYRRRPGAGDRGGGRHRCDASARGGDARQRPAAPCRSGGRAGESAQAGQDVRLDMLVIGPKTIEGALKAQLRGAAVAAGHVLMLNARSAPAKPTPLGCSSPDLLRDPGRISPLRVALAAGEHSGDQLGFKLMRALREARSATSPSPASVARRWRPRASKPVSDWRYRRHGHSSGAGPAADAHRAHPQTAEAIVATRPDGLVIIDSPDFTHRVARRVRAALPKSPIVDYVSPSVWAGGQSKTNLTK